MVCVVVVPVIFSKGSVSSCLVASACPVNALLQRHIVCSIQWQLCRITGLVKLGLVSFALAIGTIDTFGR